MTEYTLTFLVGVDDEATDISDVESRMEDAAIFFGDDVKIMHLATEI